MCRSVCIFIHNSQPKFTTMKSATKQPKQTRSFRFEKKEADLSVFNTQESDKVFEGFSKGCRVIGLTNGKFSLIDIIRSCLSKTGKAHVCVATWSAGIKDAHQIKWMMDSNLIQSFTIVTDHSYKTRKSQYIISLEDMFGVENIRTSEIHGKFTLIWNEDYKVCIRHSMNLNANKTVEHFEFDEGAEIFDFFMKFVEHTFGEMPKGFTGDSFTVNKALDKFFTKGQSEVKRKSWSEL